MRRYFRLFFYFFRFSLMERLEYRLDFFLNIARSIGWIFVAIIGFTVIFQNTPVLAGWNKYQALTLYGVFLCINELWYMLFFLNLTRVPYNIQSGQFDYILLLPISTQFLVSLRQVLVFTFPNAVLSLFVIGHYSSLAVEHIPISTYIMTAFLVLNGLIILYSIMFIAVTTSFWIIRLKAFWEFYGLITEGARYPVDIFKDPLHFIFVFIIPLALIFTFPAQLLVRGLSPFLVLTSFIVGIGIFVLAHKFFYFGIRHYNSASS